MNHSARGFQSGFTLIELMISILIIAILSTVGIVTYSSSQRSARISKRAQDLEAIRTAIELFKSSTGKYPLVSAAQTFGCINANLTGANSLTPTYMATIPDDPENSANCFQYTSDAAGTNYKLRTNPGIPTSEMAYTDFNQKPSILDPAKDGSSSSCAVDPLTTNSAKAWAYYTNGACLW